jgi:hypothetical protein
MNLRKYIALVIFIHIILITHLTAEESNRCNGSLIDLGELISTVLHKCGDPTDSIEYSVYSIVHQRFTVSTTTKKPLLVDEFTVEVNYAQSSGKKIDEINDSELHDTLAQLSQNSTDDTFTYKNRKVRRKIFNSDLLVTLNTKYTYWESIRVDYKMKKLVYNMGPSQFVRVLIFRNGELWKMEFKEYGY